MARELTIRITADGRQAIDTFRQVDRAVAQTEQTTGKASKAQTGLVDAYGRALKPTRDFAAAQDQVNTKQKTAVTVTDQLTSVMARYASIAGVGAALAVTLKYASGLDKLATTLDTTIRGVQELENIAISTNTTVDRMADSFFKLELRLLQGDKGAVNALKELKINITEFTNLPMEQRLYLLNQRFKELGDHIDKDQVGAALFERDWKHVLAAVTGDINELKNAFGFASDESVKSAARFDTAWNGAIAEAKRGAVEFYDFLKGGVTLPFDVVAWASAALGFTGGATPDPIRLGIGPVASHETPVDRLRRAGISPVASHDMTADTRPRDLFAGIQTQDAGLALTNRYQPSAWTSWMNTQMKGFEEAPTSTFIASNFGTSVGEAFLPSRSLTSGLGYGPASLTGIGPSTSFWGRSGLTAGSLSQSIAGAVMGGGNVGGSIGATLAGGAGTALGSTVGGTLGSIIPGAGTLLGSWLGSGITKLFGPSEESAKVNEPRQAFFEDKGGLETLNPQLLQATGSLQLAQDLFDAKTEKDMKAAMDAINGALDTYIKKLGEAETALAGVTLQSEHITEITPEMQAALEEAMSATTIDDYNAAMGTLGSLMDDQITKQKELDDTLKKYGISWTETGERAKMAKLADIASGISKEFDILRGAGVDVNVVMGKMGPHVNDFVKDARKAGVEVPESFKHIIQTAIDSGQVFDDNGAKVEDITKLGLTFGTTMQDVQREMVDAMKELARVLKEDLGGAFRNVRDQANAEFRQIPREIDIEVNYTSEGFEGGESSHAGSIIRPWGLERYHAGGLLPDERLIIGQTGEGILNRRAVANLGAGTVHALNRGAMPAGGFDLELRAEVKGLRADMEQREARRDRQLPELVARALLAPRPR